ncbi:hypothetical protein Ahy_A09g043374 [Arachis hypogaea]|uniref:CCHC-type domain-containing protein n=1 Tax=Arachis hypogaea TaxID=3818 RepID=A0A445BI50_ARAHY|nr:hypothetical protein Ahy_A09g043374 [Arachis hypogaea]
MQRSPSKEGCDWYLDALGKLSHKIVDWALRFRKELWLQHCDEGRRYGHVTTNLSESVSIEWGHFVDTVYTMASVFKVYEREFSSIPDKKMWPPWYGARLKPNSAMRRKASGRPLSIRIRNDMDAIEHAKKRCRFCRREGHTRRECPNSPHSDP